MYLHSTVSQHAWRKAVEYQAEDVLQLSPLHSKSEINAMWLRHLVQGQLEKKAGFSIKFSAGEKEAERETLFSVSHLSHFDAWIKKVNRLVFRWGKQRIILALQQLRMSKANSKCSLNLGTICFGNNSINSIHFHKIILLDTWIQKIYKYISVFNAEG